MNARMVEAYGMDVPTAKRQIQIEKRKARLAEAKAKKEANARVVVALQFDRTVEQIAMILNISVSEVQEILNKQTSDRS